jgi:drug/metabolite transporter (DMT)-like permease
MNTATQPRRWKVLLAFAIIYLVWGSTFFAIRVGVSEVPPFLLAGIRFLIAGALLYGWMRIKGTPTPSLREWSSASVLAVLIFVIDYGLVFWSERRVPSGITAVMLATIPAFTAIAEILIMKTQKLTGRLAVALTIGLGGVAVLVSRTASFGDAPVDRTGALALIVGSISWSIAAPLSRKLPLPSEKAMSSAAQMFSGGVFLILTAALLQEFRGFHAEAVSAKAWLSLAYLIVAGSIAAFTAYVWLLHHESPTKVGTYAYVNPVVAVIIGYFFGGEPFGLRTLLGTLCVLVSVILITTMPAKRPQPALTAQLSTTAES